MDEKGNKAYFSIENQRNSVMYFLISLLATLVFGFKRQLNKKEEKKKRGEREKKRKEEEEEEKAGLESGAPPVTQKVNPDFDPAPGLRPPLQRKAPGGPPSGSQRGPGLAPDSKRPRGFSVLANGVSSSSVDDLCAAAVPAVVPRDAPGKEQQQQQEH